MQLLADDATHVQKCHDRWVRQMHRDMDSPSYREEWLTEQCCSCKFYIRLIGLLRPDWGVCSNSESKLDRTLMFEHDGCSKFVEGDN